MRASCQIEHDFKLDAVAGAVNTSANAARRGFEARSRRCPMEMPSMNAERPFVGLADLVSAVRDGMMVALPKEESGVAMEAERELIRRGVKRLHILCVPAAGLQADMLI